MTDTNPPSLILPQEETPTSAALLTIELRKDTRSWLFRRAAALRGRTPLRQARPA